VTAVQHYHRYAPRGLSDVRIVRTTGDILATAGYSGIAGPSAMSAPYYSLRYLLFNIDAASIICFSHKRQALSCKTRSLSRHGSSAAAASSSLHLQRLDFHVGSNFIDNVNAACIQRSSFSLSVQALRASTSAV